MPVEEITLTKRFLDPRMGVLIREYNLFCKDIAQEICQKIKNKVLCTDNMLVLGTEEFMYPAIMTALEIEHQHIANSVRCHSTTRSPIGINNSDDYPIKEGYKIPSFYDSSRETYIYNLKKYDKIIIITDSCGDSAAAISKLSMALTRYGNEDIIYIRGGRHV